MKAPRSRRAKWLLEKAEGAKSDHERATLIESAKHADEAFDFFLGADEAALEFKDRASGRGEA